MSKKIALSVQLRDSKNNLKILKSGIHNGMHKKRVKALRDKYGLAFDGQRMTFIVLTYNKNTFNLLTK